MTRRTVLLGAGCAAGTLALGGCGGGDASGTGASAAVAVVAASPTPTPTPSPTPTPTPTPTPAATPLSGVVVQAGDSIGVGIGADGGTDWAAIDHLGFPATVAIHNVSVSGRTLATGYDLRAVPFAYADAGLPSVLLIQQGTNDLATYGYGTTGAGLYANTATPFVAAARAAGFYVVLSTLLPRADASWTAATEAERLAYNALVRANAAGADAISDLAADPAMGDGAPVTKAYYYDLLHPNLAGQQRIAAIEAAVLAPLLARAPRAAG